MHLRHCRVGTEWRMTSWPPRWLFAWPPAGTVRVYYRRPWRCSRGCSRWPWRTTRGSRQTSSASLG